MKRLLLIYLVTISFSAYSQTTYYWVGGLNPSNVATLTNWNTSLNGSGSSRTSTTTATDILVFDGTNLGGAAPTTGILTGPLNGGMTCAQILFTNNVSVVMIRTSTGTGTINIAGETGEDFVIEAGSSLALTSTIGSVRFAMAATNTGRVSGELSMITTLQARIDNTISGSPGSLIFTNGSKFTTNITSASSSYAFGSVTQSSEKWVVFEAGAHLYYEGGFSPMGNVSTFSAIDFKPGSYWHHRATNAVSGAGSFFNKKSFANIIVENNSTLNAEGPVYRIDSLTIQPGATFNTHLSGQTVITSALTVDGSLLSDPTSNNELILAGYPAQTVSGTGTISVANLIIADNAEVELERSISVQNAINVFGELNFKTNQITGASGFIAKGRIAPIAATGNPVAGSYMITGNTTIPTTARGLSISGAGLSPGTAILAFSGTTDTIYISHPILAGGTGVTLEVESEGATLKTSNTNGFDPTTGSVISTGNKVYEDSINYIIHAPTTSPFGLSTGSLVTKLLVGHVTVNAAVTCNASVTIVDSLGLNARLSLRPADTLRLLAGAGLSGTFGPTNYIATEYDITNGNQGIFQYDGIGSTQVFPVGTPSHYLPVTISPTSSSDFSITVFEGITSDGLLMGPAMTPTQKQSLVNASWNINRLNGTDNAGVQIAWTTPLEGSTFTTLPGSDIGLIHNTGSAWSLPLGTGDNNTNTAGANVSSFGAFSAGAVPSTQPFIFNALPVKTYGDADFNGGASSLNTTQPIVYSSSNTAVATITGNDIHITGVGSTEITASQASDGVYPAASVTQTLTVNKAALTITADDQSKYEGEPLPILTVTYTGFVLGETSSVLTTLPVVNTTAVAGSVPGTYPITVTGAAAANYSISYVNGVMTVLAKQNQAITFNNLPVKTYGNPDFATGATSTNSTIPITYTTSNPGVATVTGNIIHIEGAGTTSITASQAGNAGFFPATDVSRTLTVNKAALTIKVSDTSKLQGEANPEFTIIYSGFVLGETTSDLLSPAVATTTASTQSTPGIYPITVGGATTNNYNITYTNGKLTILPVGGSGQPFMNAYQVNSNTIRVNVFLVEPALGNIAIYDMAGHQVLKKNLFMPAGFIYNDVYVPKIPSGIYIVRIEGGRLDLKKRLVFIK